MSKKFSDIFNKIKYAKVDPTHNKPHTGGSTDDEEHGAVSELEFGQQVAHAKKRSMTESEAVKRTQTNIKNVEKAKTGYSIDDEEYRKHIERMKKQNAEYIKNNPNTIYKRTESDEQIDEISDELANKVRDKRTAQGRSWRQNPVWTKKSSKNFALNLARDSRKRKNRVPSPEEIKYARDAEELRNYNKKMGYSNESVEVFGEILESKKSDIVRNAFETAKKKKKNEKNDNDVSGKVEKFQPDPVMTDTIEKQ